LHSELLECISPWKDPSSSPKGAQDIFVARNFYTDSSLGKKNWGGGILLFVSASLQTQQHLQHLFLDCMVFGFCPQYGRLSFFTAFPKPISINNPNNKSEKDSSTHSLTRIACVCCVLVNKIFLLCLIQKHLFFPPSFILLH